MLKKSNTQVKDALSTAVAVLKVGEVAEPEKSAEFLMRFVLGLTKAQLFVALKTKIPLTVEQKFNSLIVRRLRHEPVWYITGRIEFCGLDLSVTSDVLIPRPETEFLVEEALRQIERFGEGKCQAVLDIGTGSGAIILALAYKLKANNSKLETSYHASDISVEALAVAKKNAERLGLDKEIEFRQGSLLVPWKDRKFDLVLANLPYIPHEDMTGLSLDIHHWEPRTALDGGRRGLEVYEKFFKEIGNYLREGAVILAEIGHDQGQEITQLAQKYLPGCRVNIWKDYSENERMAIIQN